MINTILIDDEPRNIAVMQNMLLKYCPQVHVMASCSDAYTAREQINAMQPDLIFLDIAMPGKSGIEMLAEMPDIKAEVIFVTAYNQYSIEAFRYSAVDYLLKPVDEKILEQAVQRAQKRIEAGQVNQQLQTLAYNMARNRSANEMKLCLPSLKGFQVIKLMDIIYCEAESSYTIFYLTNQTRITVSRTLHEYEQVLEAGRFLRVHKSFLINLDHIKEYQRGEGGTVTLTNGMEIEISRRRKDVFLSKMKDLYNL
ncbi:MAG: LytTR family DNA-binding domain-containing protein [Chitinophagaceae bacterium]